MQTFGIVKFSFLGECMIDREVPWSINQLLLNLNVVCVGKMNPLCSFHSFQEDGNLIQN